MNWQNIRKKIIEKYLGQNKAEVEKEILYFPKLFLSLGLVIAMIPSLLDLSKGVDIVLRTTGMTIMLFMLIQSIIHLAYRKGLQGDG